MDDKNMRLKESVIKNFFTSNGKLRNLPVQLKKKLIVLENLVSRLDKGRKYTEKEINEFIMNFHDDFATIRREFIMHQFMFRENQIYEQQPKGGSKSLRGKQTMTERATAFSVIV